MTFGADELIGKSSLQECFVAVFGDRHSEGFRRGDRRAAGGLLRAGAEGFPNDDLAGLHVEAGPNGRCSGVGLGTVPPGEQHTAADPLAEFGRLNRPSRRKNIENPQTPSGLELPVVRRDLATLR